MDRKKAESLLKKHLKQENLLKHCYAVEAAMREFADYFGKDEKKWGIAGLLHDIDYEYTKDNHKKHGLKAEKIIKKAGYDLEEKIINAIKAHGGNYPINTKMDKVLHSVDPLTGLIVASALMHPSKDITQMETDFVLRRYDEKNFAKGASREIIQKCTDFMPLEDFVYHTLKAMQNINDVLEL
jgi:hypothetical protein